MLSTVKKQFPTKLKIMLYNSLFMPHMNYGINIWGYGKNHKCIEKLQKWALRTTLNLKYNAHTSPHFARHNLMKFQDIRDLAILTKMRQVITREAPKAYFDYEFFEYYPEKNRKPHYFKTELTKSPYDKLPLYSFPKLWNSINLGKNDLMVSIKAFKNMMKVWYTSKYETTCTKKMLYMW